MKGLLISSIRIYQRMISPFKSSRCPFVPSCSEYGVCALSEYGAAKGSILTVWRVIRCNPFNKAFLDPPSNWAKKLHFSQIIKNIKPEYNG